MISGGHESDGHYLKPALESVMIPQKNGRSRNRPEKLVTDKGYDAKKIRRYLRKRGITPIIPQRQLRPGARRRQRGPKPGFDKKLYRKRNIIERMIGWLKNCRRLATRFEKTASAFLWMVKLAFIQFYLKKYFSDTT